MNHRFPDPATGSTEPGEHSAATADESAAPQLLRLITAGSVDDGKSTLIGRLLFDAKAILGDQLAALSSARNKRVALGEIDFSFLTDGLEAEREQGITIDVAYRYFATGRKKFIIADCPGHEQYTRNMVTGASTADVAIILIDATRVTGGQLLTQTRRHTALAQLLHIPHIVVAVNKMDLVGYSQAHFQAIVAAYQGLLADLATSLSLGGASVHYLPISALGGDNVVEASSAMPWYRGPSLLSLLETLSPPVLSDQPLRLPVQLVMRWGGHTAHDHRAYAGRVASGRLRQGEVVQVFPSGAAARVERIVVNGAERQEVSAGMSVMVYLDRDLDVSRGDVLVAEGQMPSPSRTLTAHLAWLDGEALLPSRRYRLRQASRDTLVKLEVKAQLNVNSAVWEAVAAGAGLAMNGIAQVVLTSAQPLLPDAYAALPATGCFILIDEASNQTAGAGMFLPYSPGN